MDRESESDYGVPQSKPRFRRAEGYIDFYEAFRCRMKMASDVSSSEMESPEEVETILVPIRKLIGQYSVTAMRVGANLDAELLREVIKALRHESVGEPEPLAEISCKEATEQFLAESLYHEILDTSPKDKSSRNSRPCSQILEKWQMCLDLLDKSLSPQNIAA